MPTRSPRWGVDGAPALSRHGLRSATSSVLAIGGVAFILGFLLQYERGFQRSDVLVEALATRDATILERVDRVDDITDHFGNTPLDLAVKTSLTHNYDPVPILIERMQDVDARDEHGRAALFDAVRTGRSEAVAPSDPRPRC